MSRVTTRVVLAALAFALVPIAEPERTSSAPSAVAGTAPHPASAHREISTAVPAAQAAFNFGLALTYAFNEGQAREEFARAAALDPNCAMAHWGEALTEITDINEPPDGAAIARGYRAAAAARVASAANPAERRLIAAIVLRFAPGASEGKRQKDYATAMRAYARAYPTDADGLVETAFAVWNFASDVSDPSVADIGRDLDAALALDPNQIGALHLRIHFEEEIGRPEAGLSTADTLDAMAFLPGESHIVHMPSHIYDRVGDYARMSRANLRAIQNDRTYFAFANVLYPDVGEAGVTYMRRYHQHDVDFVLYGDTTVGRDADATAFAAGEGSRAIAWVALRLHRWQAVLDSGTPDRAVLAIADARLGRSGAALRLLDKSTLPVNRDLVVAAIAIARGDTRGAVAAYAAAYEHATDPGLGDPKTSWWAPVGEGYAAALLRAKRYADAEKVFANELERYPNDPHLLLGLATARDALGEPSDEARASIARYWENATPLDLERLG